VAEQGADLAAALQRWLQDHGTSAEVTIGGRATVGLSQETWFLTIRLAERTVPAVLRRPTASSGKRSLVTQIAAMEGLSGTGIPCPRVLWSDLDDDNPLGRPFFVMERIAGSVPVGWHDFQPADQQLFAEQAVDILGDLHAIGPDRLGPDAVPTFDLSWYERRFEKLGGAPPVLKAALWWMRRHAPEPTGQPVIVHGDFRMGNFVVDAGRIAGILDWEMASIGDPIEDLAWCTLPVWDRPMVDEAALIRRYEQRTGRAVPQDRYRWYRALGYVRCVYYAMSGTHAFDAGLTTDLRLAALRLRVPVQLERLMALISGDSAI